MANTLLSPADITYRAAYRFFNNLRFVRMIDRQYSSMFAQQGAKRGNTIFIRMPPRYVVTDGPIAQVQDITETSVTLTLDQYKDVALTYSSQDLTLDIDDFDNRILAPAMDQLANEVDRVVLSLVIDKVYNSTGTPGTRPNDSQLFLDAKAIMGNESTPRDQAWQALLTNLSEASMVKTLQALFNAPEQISEQYRQGQMGRAFGFDWDVDENMPTHTNGALGGTPLVNGAGQTGASLVTDGWTNTTGAVAKGDIFTIAGVYQVNPLSRRSTGQLRQFVVTAANTADGSGNMTIAIDPPITPPDALGNVTQFQTVSASPANDAAITVLGAASVATPQNLCFYPKFATVAFADLEMPHSGIAYRVSDEQLGISFRLWKDSNWGTDTHGTRCDVLFGVAVPRPQWACRVAS
jgi:coat protein Gp5